MSINRLIIDAAAAKARLFTIAGELESLVIPTETAREASKILPPFETLLQVKNALILENHDETMLRYSRLFAKRIHNYSFFVIKAKELIELLSSIATRVYTNNSFIVRGVSTSHAKAWLDRRERALRLYSFLDELLIYPTEARREEAAEEIEIIGREFLDLLPENYVDIKSGYLGNTAIRNELHELLLECEVWAIAE